MAVLPLMLSVMTSSTTKNAPVKLIVMLSVVARCR